MIHQWEGGSVHGHIGDGKKPGPRRQSLSIHGRLQEVFRCTKPYQETAERMLPREELLYNIKEDLMHKHKLTQNKFTVIYIIYVIIKLIKILFQKLQL